ncbi:MAG: Holliday junction resolvase RuvX [Phycisphaerales bacterium]|nr:Holliday junction resolvase RuvX [Phycisphaerales bacterium]
MGRWLGVDYGTRRIGLAIGDDRSGIASPLTTLAASGHAPTDARAVLQAVREHEADGVVVGLPLSMDGTDSEQTRITRAFAAALQVCVPGPVELFDERLSSFQADAMLAETGVRRGRHKSLRDALAAQVILRTFLEGRASRNQEPTTDEAQES